MSLLETLLHPHASNAPHLEALFPEAAMPGGEIEMTGTSLSAQDAVLPLPMVGDVPAPLAMSSESRAIVRIPEGAITGDISITTSRGISNRLPVRIATPLAENVHPVCNPAVDADGNIYTTLSGARGQQTPVSVFRIDRSLQIRPFAREIMNASGLAFDRDGYLYCSSRAEGVVYRISPAGTVSQFVEGMGIATGLALDAEGNLFVGDRSGTIFKVSQKREIYVHATLEPSVAAYHLAVMDDAGSLIVSTPNTASHDAIYAVTPNGEVSTYFRGLGRPQGMAVSNAGDVYIAASYKGRRGIVRITPQREASLVVSGMNLLGIAFTGDGIAALATRDSLHQIDMQVEGRSAL